MSVRAAGEEAAENSNGGYARSRGYWVGYMLGYFQCMTGWTYERIFAAINYADLREMSY